MSRSLQTLLEDRFLSSFTFTVVAVVYMLIFCLLLFLKIYLNQSMVYQHVNKLTYLLLDV